MSNVSDQTKFLLTVQLYDSPWEVDDCAEYLEKALKACREGRRSLDSAEAQNMFAKETKLLADRVTELKARLDAASQERLDEGAHPDMHPMILDSIALDNMARNINMVRISMNCDNETDDVWLQQLEEAGRRRAIS